MRGCWNGSISPFYGDRGNYGSRRFFECVVRVVEPSVSLNMVPCFSVFESVPGVVGFKNSLCTRES